MDHNHSQIKVISIKNILALIFSLLFISLFFILEFTNLLYNVEDGIITSLDNQKSQILLKDNVPKNIDKVFLDINKQDISPNDFTVYNSQGEKISFYKTLFGSTAQIPPEKIDTDLNLTLSTYKRGQIDTIITYTDSTNAMLKQTKESYYFEQNYILLYIFRFGIIFVGLILGLVTISVIKSKLDRKRNYSKKLEVDNENIE